MRGTNRCWILLLAVVLLAATACTENDLDESEASVVLEILGISNPEVQGDTGGAGQCTGDPTIPCLDNQTCIDNQAGVCDFPDAACTVTDWSVSVANRPLNDAGLDSPFNDIVVISVVISYLNLDGSNYAPDRTVPIGATVTAGSVGTVTFAPIAFDDISTDNTTVNLVLGFDAVTVSGEDVEVAGGNGAQLFIEDCIP
jgi:hypothetical protein